MSLYREDQANPGFQIINRSQKRVDGYEKVTGVARYAGDIYLPGMLYGAGRSLGIPSARIRSMNTKKALAMPGVHAVLTPFDVEKQVSWSNHRYITDVVRYCGDCIALAAAETPELARRALAAIEVEYDELPGVFTLAEAMEPGAHAVHEEYPDNIAPGSLYHIRKGDVAAGFAASDVILERTYTTQRQEHVYLEPEAVVAFEHPTQGKITVHASTQYPHFTRKYIADILGLDLNCVQLIQETVGGSFGGKEEGIGLLAARAASLCKCTGRPVRMVYSREESIERSSKRHPFQLTYKVGATRAGKILAWEGTQIADCGAYDNHVPYVDWRANVHSAGAYDIPNIKTDTYGVFTNNPYCGAFRGYSSPQLLFGQEQLIDELAEALGLSPAELRRRNCLKDGSTCATGSKVSPVSLEEMMAHTLEEADFENRYAANRRQTSRLLRKGIGMAISHRGCGYGAESSDASGASIIILEDGSVTINSGLAENGQGLRTAYVMIAAEALGVPMDTVFFACGDTQSICDSGLTAASRGTYVGAQSMRKAGEQLNRIMRQNAVELGFFKEHPEVKSGEDLELKYGSFFAKSSPAFQVAFRDVASACRWNGKQSSIFSWYIPGELYQDHETGQGRAFHSFAYACVVAEVEVDMGTGFVSVQKVIASHDIGRAINPSLIRGQIYGGVAMGQGYGTTECLTTSHGKILEHNYDTYIIPTTLDMPEVTVNLFECEDDSGTYGSKSIGEPAMECVAGAIANAVYNATGKRLRTNPLNLETVLLGENLVR